MIVVDAIHQEVLLIQDLDPGENLRTLLILIARVFQYFKRKKQQPRKAEL